MNYNKETKVLTIEYEEKDSVNRVVERDEIKFQGKVYKAFRKKDLFNPGASMKPINKSNEVKPKEKAIFDNFKFIIKFIQNMFKSEITDEDIKNYIEGRLLHHHDYKLYKYYFWLEDDPILSEGILNYLVTSNKEIDFDKLISEFNKKPTLCDRMIQIERIKIENTNLLVKLEKPEEHCDRIENYFRNQSMSGGGPIKTFKKIKKYCFVEFEDKARVKQVLDKSHGNGIDVFAFFDTCESFECQFETDKNYKICPLCTTHNDITYNFCKTCSYKFSVKNPATNSSINLTPTNPSNDQSKNNGIILNLKFFEYKNIYL